MTDREVLPTNVKPLHYDLTLEPLFDTFTFNGESIIDFAVNEKTDYITLNSWDIDIKKALINDVSVSETAYDIERQTVTFKFKEPLDHGTVAKLQLQFMGTLNEEMNGFYKLSYDDNGETKYMASSHLEPTACRRAFPCYDEPAAKAKFTISLVADQNLACLSNMNVRDTEVLKNGKKKVHFETTPLMSTYITAFIVGDLKYVENNSYKVPVRVYAVPSSVDQCKYAAEIAAKCLDFFSRKFDIDYVLPKCDLIAVPDFLIGGMENFGMITFKQQALLFDPEKSDLDSQITVTEVVSHELAHQWFGNLVTMEFWDGLWLKEGFATWMSWYASNHLFPEWKVWDSYVSNDLQRALTLDALRSSHPIDVPVKSAAQIGQIFDAISYSKGSAVLTMVSNWLGEDVFIKGVSKYLKKHKWGSTKNSDLWDAMSEESGQDVNSIMDKWTLNVGYPVVKVEEEGSELTFTQSRFLSAGMPTSEEDSVLYPIFLGLKTSEGVDMSQVLDTRSKKIKLSDDFFKVNNNQFGVYRTAYSSERYGKLGKSASKLSVSDRIGLVADAAALASAGYIPTSDLFTLVRFWTKEDNYVVWGEILKRLGDLKTVFVFEDPVILAGINKFILDLISEKIEQIGYDIHASDPLDIRRLKLELLAAGVLAGHEHIVAYAKGKFTAYIYGDDIDPSLYSIIFKAVALTGDSTTFKQLLEIYNDPKTIQQKSAVLSSLGHFDNAEILAEVLDLLLRPGVVRQQDILTGLRGFSSHPLGINTRWSWFTKNWAEVTKTAPPNSTMLGNFVTICSAAFTQPLQKDAVEKFFLDKNTKGFSSPLSQVYELIDGKIERVARDYDVIVSWLDKEGYVKND